MTTSRHDPGGPRGSPLRRESGLWTTKPAYRQLWTTESALCRDGHTVPAVTYTRRLYVFELEPEVRDWLADLSDFDYKRADEVCGMLAEKGTGLGGPWSDHLVGEVWELRLRLAQAAVRVT